MLHASALKSSGATAELTAVVIEPAQAAHVAPIYRACPRLDAPTARPHPGEIATSSLLSVHTVRDYIKSIFEKLAVNSRGALVA
jgi:hypothetical protein